MLPTYYRYHYLLIFQIILFCRIQPTFKLYAHEKMKFYTISSAELRNKSEIPPDISLDDLIQSGVLKPPPKKVNYFDLMKQSVNFNIDIKELSKKHRQLQTQLHPDKYSTKSVEEKENSENWSALVNEAYATLLNPMKRALYLLDFYGDPLLEKEQPQLDAEFLTEIMELNEELDEIDDDVNTIEAFRNSINERIDDLHGSLLHKFEVKEIAQAKIIVAKMQYFHNLKNQLKEKEY